MLLAHIKYSNSLQGIDDDSSEYETVSLYLQTVHNSQEDRKCAVRKKRHESTGDIEQSNDAKEESNLGKFQSCHNRQESNNIQEAAEKLQRNHSLETRNGQVET